MDVNAASDVLMEKVANLFLDDIKKDEALRTRLIRYLSDCMVIPNWFDKGDIETYLGKPLTEKEMSHLVKEFYESSIPDDVSEMFWDWLNSKYPRYK